MRLVNKLFLFTPLLLQTAVWPFTRLFFWFFLRWKINGLANLKGLSKGVIFAANHSSELDPILVPAALPFLSKFMPMFYVSRPRKFYQTSGWRQFFYGGAFFKIWGAHSAISGYKDYGVSLSPHIHIIQHGHSLLIFPEGQKTTTGEVMVEKAHGGVSFLAEKTGLPVVPICINGAFKMSFVGFFLRKNQVSISFGKPVFAQELFSHQTKTDNKFKTASKIIMESVSILNNARASPVNNFKYSFAASSVKIKV